MMRGLYLLLCAMALLFAASCGSHNTTTGDRGNATVTLPMPAEYQGYMAFLTDYDTDEAVDSGIVENGMVVIETAVNEPRVCRVICRGLRRGIVILEPGDIHLDTALRFATGTPLNDELIALAHTQDSLSSAYSRPAAAGVPDSLYHRERIAIMQQYDLVTRQAMDRNADNTLGYYLAMQEAYEMSPAQLDSLLSIRPTYRNGVRMKRLIEARDKQNETAAGAMFKDFAVKGDTSTVKLSDYVGRGTYTLVDFWASWCGPCMREMDNLRKIDQQYGPHGLKLLGVAVWDKREDTDRALDRLQLPWPQIIDAQRIPTDMYGITSIPCLILFDPEGRIVYRGEGGAELRQELTRLIPAHRPE